ncbi:Ribonuclease BN [bioreactor metagenome]|uniref:Ribonuclease BN n=1 Tax=bioreactor metagenome TaxID=1076179 RepID=A0A645DHK6_9ZZZZ
MQLFAYGLDILSKRVSDLKLPLDVFAPATPQEEYARIKKNDVFNVLTINDSLHIDVGDIAIIFYRGTHPVESYAMDICAEGKRLFYTGDTAEDKNIMDAAAGADVLLCDVNFTAADEWPGAPHFSAPQAARFAREANVGQLICTHIFPRYSDDQVLKEIKPVFDRSNIAEEFKIYEF